MNTVKDILDHKGKNVWSVAPKDTLLTALKMMEAHKVGSLLVIDQGVIKGIVTGTGFCLADCRKRHLPVGSASFAVDDG